MKVSIVTITYNAARTLQRTLDSVACQTYADIEHLIIDGASKDDTLAIAERYQSQSRHTVVVRSEPDRGLYDAMNKGLWRHRHHRWGGEFPASASSSSARTAVVEIIQAWHAGMSSGILCSYGYC